MQSPACYEPISRRDKVLDDADIDTAARCIAQGSMLHSGQICMSTERVIVMRPVAEAFKSKLSAIVSKLKAGDPFSDSSVRLSALFSEGSAENVVNMIKEAKDDGAQVILGDLSRQGALVQPHLVVGVKPGMRLWDRESFGPGNVCSFIGCSYVPLTPGCMMQLLP